MKLIGGNFSSDPTFDINRVDSTETGESYNLFSQATQALGQEAWETGPSASAVDVIGNAWTEQFMPKSDISMTNKLTEEELDDRKDRDYYAQFMTIPKEGMTDWQYDTALAETRERMIRQSTIGRAPDTYLQGAKSLGVSLAVGIADPTNIVAAYLPTLAFAVASRTALVETAAMKNLTKTVKNYDQALSDMTAIQRAGTRAKYGSMESVPGAALVEVPMVYGAELRGEEYTMEDVFRSIAFGLVIDTSIHVGGGALYDVAQIPDRAARRALQTKIKSDEVDAYATVAKQEAELATIQRNAQLEVDNASALQRFQAKMTPGDRAAVAQTTLAQHVNDSRVDVNGLLETIEAKLLETGPTDAASVRAAVVQEMKARENDALGISTPTHEMAIDYDKSFETLRNDVDTLEGELTGRTPTERSRSGQTAKIRSELEEKLPRLIRSLEAELRGDAPTTRSRKGKTAKIRAELEAARARMLQLDADFVGSKFDNPIETQNKIDAEVERRIALIEGGAEGARVNQIQEMLDGLKQTAEAPENQRTYVEGAEGIQKTGGQMQTDEAATSAVAEQAADANENANLMAEEMGVKFEPDAEAEAVTKELDEMIAISKSLGLCMGRTAT